MDFKEAIILMENGKICVNSNSLSYRYKNDRLEYSDNNDWFPSKCKLSILMNYEWKLHDDERTLSDKVFNRMNETVYSENNIIWFIKKIKEIVNSSTYASATINNEIAKLAGNRLK